VRTEFFEVLGRFFDALRAAAAATAFDTKLLLPLVPGAPRGLFRTGCFELSEVSLSFAVAAAAAFSTKLLLPLAPAAWALSELAALRYPHSQWATVT